MKVLISHPTGNQNVRAAATGFAEADLIDVFHTSIATFSGDLLDHISAFGPLSELSRRRFDLKLKNLTKVWPWREVGRLIATKAGMRKLIKHEVGPFCIDAVYQSLDRRVASNLPGAAKRGARAVYAYEDGASFSFHVAKNLGLQCLYDLPIGYWRAAQRLMEIELEKWPDWASTLTSFHNSEKKLCRKDEELRLADRIFVASTFTAKTLQEFPGVLAPIEVIPYGFPPICTNRSYSANYGSKALKILFVGGLSQRKGIANLFAAVETLGHHVELTIIGQRAATECAVLDAALLRHKWYPSLPHNDVLKLMQLHDVLVFPSLFEGFGLVITEAMSQGTPVITTERTAGPDLIFNGQNGWLIEAGSTQALKAAIEELLSKPAVIPEVGMAAMDTARQRSWETYGRELALAVGGL
ncbi:glycosyl transferase family 1 [Pontibacter korlensis]|uniref:Glycosyl transferase family 1 n=1 Tax=Pontibacter korlensis TaxID=400092 RepID=A0A0E3UX67_9BACT|nr:glycosyltransferase family 4 protein [Pontibacter korlensis]AKD03982.1 glycosyl transferase family 1 [Pontibacter korlensis]